MRLFGSMLFVLALCVAVLYGGPALAAVTPEGIKAFIDGPGIIIIFAWGILCKYAPFLKGIPNFLITWLGAIGYVLAKLAVPEAHAFDGSAILDAGGSIIGGFTSAVWARQLYEGFARPLLEHVLGWRKAGAPAEYQVRA